MKRFLCLSLCLGIMASACRVDITKNLDDANAKRAEDTQTEKTTPNKQQVLEACLPQINGLLIAHYRAPNRTHFFLRKTARRNGTAEQPIVVLYTHAGMPLRFSRAAGLGATVAAAKANLNAMAASKVIQDQFVARDNNASGWRVHISIQTSNEGIAVTRAGVAPVSSESLIVYDPEAIAAANLDSFEVIANNTLWTDRQSAWYDCVLDETTQKVTVLRTAAILQA